MLVLLLIVETQTTTPEEEAPTVVVAAIVPEAKVEEDSKRTLDVTPLEEVGVEPSLPRAVDSLSQPKRQPANAS